MLLIQMVMLLTGLLMVAAPETCTRKQSRSDANVVKKTKTMGIWLVLAVGIWLITSRLL